MPGPTHPVFLSLHTKLARLEREMANLREFVGAITSFEAAFSAEP